MDIVSLGWIGLIFLWIPSPVCAGRFIPVTRTNETSGIVKKSFIISWERGQRPPPYPPRISELSPTSSPYQNLIFKINKTINP